MIALTISCHISTEFAFVIPKILSLAAYLLYSILSHWQVWNQYTQYFSRIKNISRYFNLVNGKSLNDTLKMQKKTKKKKQRESILKATAQGVYGILIRLVHHWP